MRGATTAAAATALSCASGGELGPAPKPKPEGTSPLGGVQIGFHTAAFNSAYFSFEKCLAWAQRNEVHCIECGVIDGVT